MLTILRSLGDNITDDAENTLATLKKKGYYQLRHGAARSPTKTTCVLDVSTMHKVLWCDRICIPLELSLCRDVTVRPQRASRESEAGE